SERLLHQQDGAAALDFARDLAVHVSRHAGHASRQDLSALRHKFLQQIGIFIIDGFRGDIDAAPRHGAVGPAESGTAFGGLWLHDGLARLPVQCMPLQEGIVFLFLEPVGGARALLVASAHVARDGGAERLRFRAFQSDDFLRHNYSLLSSALASSSSPSAPSSSVRPKSDVTDCRTRDALFCFSSCDWHSTVKRANGIASSRACEIGLPDISQMP